MPHICHITSSHPALDNRIFRHECVSLAKAGCRVTLLAPDHPAAVISGVKIVRAPLAGSGKVRRMLRGLVFPVFARSIQADGYHFHDPELIPGMLWLARVSGKPVIWDAHENYVFTTRQFNSLRHQGLSNAYAGWFDANEIRACQNFAGVVTITDVMAERYRQFGIPTCAVGNFVDLERIQFPPAAARSARPRIISTGVQHIDKGAFELLTAAASLNPELDCELAYWGIFDPPGLREQLHHKARELNLDEGRLITGGPYKWEVLVGGLIPSARVGCVLFDTADKNNCIGLPNRFFELWANAIPVIATEGTEVARLVREEQGGIVVGMDPESIAGAIRQLVENPEMAARFGANGRRAVEQKYNWGKAGDRLVSFYASLGLGCPGTGKQN